MALVLMHFGRTLLEQTIKTNCTTFDTLDPEMRLFGKKGLGLASYHILCMIVFFFLKKKILFMLYSIKENLIYKENLHSVYL